MAEEEEQEQEEEEDENKRIRPWERAHGQKNFIHNRSLPQKQINTLRIGIKFEKRVIYVMWWQTL